MEKRVIVTLLFTLFFAFPIVHAYQVVVPIFEYSNRGPDVGEFSDKTILLSAPKIINNINLNIGSDGGVVVVTFYLGGVVKKTYKQTNGREHDIPIGVLADKIFSICSQAEDIPLTSTRCPLPITPTSSVESSMI